MCNNDCRRSILNICTLTKTDLEQGDRIPLEKIKVKEGKSIEFNEGNSTIKLNSPGNYLITVNAQFELAEKGTPMIIQLQNNGEDIPEAWSAMDSLYVGDIGSLSFSSLVHIKPGCPMINTTGYITLLNKGNKATYVNVNVVIVKLT